MDSSLNHTCHFIKSVFMTSRNSVWSSFFIVYFWLNSVLIFLFKDPSGVILGASVTACLDIWRHTDLWSRGAVAQILGKIFITPVDHQWHHSSGSHNCNFGANLKIWDRLHNTLKTDCQKPVEFGSPLPTHGSRLLYPFFQKENAK